MIHPKVLLLLLVAGAFIGATRAAAEPLATTFTPFLDLHGLPAQSANPEAQALTAFAKGARNGGTLKLATNQHFDLIFPQYNRGGMGVQISTVARTLVYEPLMRMDPLGTRPSTAVGWIGESMRWDPVRSSILMNIRHPVKFSDGIQVTPDDVVFSVNYMLTEVYSPIYADYFAANFGAGFEVRAMDAHLVEFHFPNLDEKHVRMAMHLIFATVAIVKPNSKINLDLHIPQPVIGTGPYRVAGATRDQLTLRRRKDYWNAQGPVGHFNEIQVQVIPERDVQRQALLRGLIDVFVETEPNKEPILDAHPAESPLTKQRVSIASSMIDSQVLFMNTIRPHLADVRFRRALWLAYDTETLYWDLYSGQVSRQSALGAGTRFAPVGVASPAVHKLMSGDALAEEAAGDFSRVGMLGLDQEQSRRGRLRRAMGELRAAGYQVRDGQLWKDGQAVGLKILIGNGEDRAVSYFVSNLRSMGIAVTYVTYNDGAARTALYQGKDFDLMPGKIEIPRAFEAVNVDVLKQRFGSAFALANFPQGRGSNESSLQSPVVDRLLNEMILVDVESDRYRDLVEALLRLLSVHFNFIPTGEAQTVTIYSSPKIHIPPVVYTYGGIWNWVELGYSD